MKIENDILCNKCGQSCKVLIDAEHTCFNMEGLRAKIRAGYGSQFDGSILKFDLCDDCVAELIKTFKIPVQETEYDLFTGEEILR